MFSKIIEKIKGIRREKEENFLVEISYGRGKRINLGYIKATEHTLMDKVYSILRERPDFTKIKYIYITFPSGVKERFENPFYEEEEEAEEEEKEGPRKRRKKDVDDILDPIELLRDTSKRLREAYALVMEESLKFQQEFMKHSINLQQNIIQQTITQSIKEAVENAVKGVVNALNKTITQQQQRRDEVLELIKTLVQAKAIQEKEKTSARKRIKVEVKGEK